MGRHGSVARRHAAAGQWMTITNEHANVTADRWEVLSRQLPDTRQAWLQALDTLSEAGDHATADAGYRQLIARDPTDKKAAFRYAGAATDRRDWAEAALRWKAVLDGDATNKIAIHSLSEAWIRLGELTAANELLEKGLHPLRGGDLAATDKLIRRMMINHARLAVRLRDWPLARRRWAALLKQLPQDTLVQTGYRRAHGHAKSETAPATNPDGGEVMAQDQWQRLEGLGSNCEFGLVQRRFGAEPLGLFRWVSLGPSKLCNALRSDLAGIGDEEFTQVEVGENGEFSTSDTRYGLAMHSFIKDVGQDRDVLFRQLKRRMVFLRRKLLEDLASGEKVFVYRSTGSLSEEAILKISAELKRHNPANALLAIAVDDPEEAPELYPIAPDVLYATIPDGRKIPLRTGWDIKFNRWAEICAAALKTLRPTQL
jgi:tetratricopeptide (TPR) repeat protein